MALEFDIYGKHIEPKEAGVRSINLLEPNDIDNLATEASVDAVTKNLNTNFFRTSGGQITGDLNISGNLNVDGEFNVNTQRLDLVFSGNVLINRIYNVDTTVGPVTATLPDDANLGDEIEFIDVMGNFKTSPFFIKSNTSKLEGLTGNLIKIDIPYSNFKLNYINTSLTGWKITFLSNNIQSRTTIETPTTGISSINSIVTLSQSTYDALTVKAPTTLYVIV